MRAHYHIKDFIFFVRQRSSDIPILKEVIQDETYFGQGFLEIEPHDVVVDIGAHIGAFCILASSKGAAVIAYEPLQRNYALLCENVEMNGFPVTTFPHGVLGNRGVKNIYYRDFNFGGSNFYNKHEFPEKVVCVTLADVFGDNHLKKIDFLKLDCEAAELEILKGSEGELGFIDKIAIEYHGARRRDDLLDFLKDYETKLGHPDEPLGVLYAKRKG